jgi:hypothetical protein
MSPKVLAAINAERPNVRGMAVADGTGEHWLAVARSMTNAARPKAKLTRADRLLGLTLETLNSSNQPDLRRNLAKLGALAQVWLDYIESDPEQGAKKDAKDLAAG